MLSEAKHLGLFAGVSVQKDPEILRFAQNDSYEMAGEINSLDALLRTGTTHAVRLHRSKLRSDSR